MATRRGYVTTIEFEEWVTDRNITITDTTVAERYLSKAEELVDAYCGFWNKYDEAMGVGGPVQLGLFPRFNDVDSTGATFIPDAVKRATLAQAEYMLTANVNNDSSGESLTMGKVTIGSGGRSNQSSVPDYDSALSTVAKRYLEAAGMVNRVGRFEASPGMMIYGEV